jgi:DNA-binding MarR family transcriptional regulator
MSESMPSGLTMSELRTWRRVGTGLSRLMSALDRQLRDESGLSADDFGILATLSATPGDALRMTELADRLSFSPSRLSHAVGRMEEFGWVVREDTPADRRGRLAHLTPEGERILRAAWPGHATLIRELLIDPLEPGQFEELDAIFVRISRAAAAHRNHPQPIDRKS